MEQRQKFVEVVAATRQLKTLWSRGRELTLDGNGGGGGGDWGVCLGRCSVRTSRLVHWATPPTDADRGLRFGLKNKNKSRKVQEYVAQVQNQAKGTVTGQTRSAKVRTNATNKQSYAK